jgi:hypothetical protein
MSPTPIKHYVRPEGLPEPTDETGILWLRLLGRIYDFMFEKKSGVPPYHGNFQGATINDPRYPGIFNMPRPDDSGSEVERNYGKTHLRVSDLSQSPMLGGRTVASGLRHQSPVSRTRDLETVYSSSDTTDI